MLPYDWVHSEFLNEYCTPLDGNPSRRWHHPIIGQFPLNILPGPPPEVAEAQYQLIMNDFDQKPTTLKKPRCHICRLRPR